MARDVTLEEAEVLEYIREAASNGKLVWYRLKANALGVNPLSPRPGVLRCPKCGFEGNLVEGFFTYNFRAEYEGFLVPVRKCPMCVHVFAPLLDW